MIDIVSKNNRNKLACLMILVSYFFIGELYLNHLGEEPNVFVFSSCMLSLTVPLTKLYCFVYMLGSPSALYNIH